MGKLETVLDITYTEVSWNTIVPGADLQYMQAMVLPPNPWRYEYEKENPLWHVNCDYVSTMRGKKLL